jgi:hypothetical protein
MYILFDSRRSENFSNFFLEIAKGKISIKLLIAKYDIKSNQKDIRRAKWAKWRSYSQSTFIY